MFDPLLGKILLRKRRPVIVQGFGGGSSSSSTTPGGGANSFSTIAVPFGTNPSALIPGDTLTITNIEVPRTITIEGDITTNTLNLNVPGAIVHPIDATNTFPWDLIPPSLAAGALRNLGLGNTTNVLSSLTTGQGNIGIGSNVLVNAEDTLNMIGIGFDIYDQVVSFAQGNYSVGIGNSIGKGVTGSVNGIVGLGFLLGMDADNLSNTVMIGNTIMSPGVVGSNMSNSLMIGNNFASAPFVYTLDSNTFIGNNILNDNTADSSVSECVVIGKSSLTNALGAAAHVIIGNNSGQRIDSATDNLFLGNSTANGIINGSGNFISGNKAANTGDINSCIVLGESAMGDATDGTEYCIALGNSALSSGLVVNTVGIGRFTFNGASSVDNSVVIGHAAGQTVDVASGLILFGAECEPTNPNPVEEACFGSHNYPLSNFYFGQGGLPTAVPGAVTFQPTGADGSNIVGSDYIFQPGNGTGTGGSGTYKIKTARPGSSGASANTMQDAIDVDQQQRLRTYSGRIVAIRVASVAGTTTTTVNDDVVAINKIVAAANSVVLPAGVTGQRIVIKDDKGDAATNNITVFPTAGNIDGASSYVLNINNQAATFVYNGTQWNVI